MPLYEYKCIGCGEVFEKLQRFSDEPLTIHETCGGHVDRLISTPSFQFKGSGFYITDYARGSGTGPPAKGDGSNKKDSASKKESASTSSSNGGTASESKPASTTTSSSSSDSKK